MVRVRQIDLISIRKAWMHLDSNSEIAKNPSFVDRGIPLGVPISR